MSNIVSWDVSNLAAIHWGDDLKCKELVKDKMKHRRYHFDPDYATPPSATLVETITAMGIGLQEQATRTGFSLQHITQIVQGHKRLTPHTAHRLAKVTGVCARLWNNLESQFQERCKTLKLNETEVRRHASEV